MIGIAGMEVVCDSVLTETGWTPVRGCAATGLPEP